MRIFPYLLLAVILSGCTALENFSLFQKPSETQAVSEDKNAIKVPTEQQAVTPDSRFDLAIQMYSEALDSVTAGSDLAAQKLFESAIIELSELDFDNLDVAEEDFVWLRWQLAQDYANFLGSLDQLPAESSPSAVYLGLSEFVGDSIGSPEDLLGVMQPVAETPRIVDSSSTHQLYPDIPIVYNSYVENVIKFYQTKGRKVYSKWLERAGEAIPYYTALLKDEGMPEELVYLAMIESGFSPKAYSRAHASGPWQFISSTAKIYNLQVGYWYDERRDKEKSTRAACQYLRKLYDQFGDWYLAFAAYNCGEGRVAKVLNRSGKDDFWGIRKSLPRQTRGYVPSILAAIIIGENPEKYGFDPIQFVEPTQYKRVQVDGCVSLKDVAKAAGVSLQTIKDLNPALKRDCTPHDAKNFTVLIPVGKGDQFDELIAQAPRLQRSEWIRHKIRSGETLSTIASKYGVSQRAIMSIQTNNLRNPHKIRAGKYLIIPVGEGKGDPVFEPAVGKPQPMTVTTEDGRTRVIHHVRRGDTLSEISGWYKVRISDIKNWNHLWGKRFIYPGQNLIVWTKTPQQAADETHISVVGPPTSGTVTDGIQVHVVRKGDTLWDISQLYGVSIRNLMDWNSIKSARRIKPGMSLQLQP
ncbi:LysM peptidoglycan-binding domain-containing protein [bacterium]|nr:LysM peptidoglycan-binding domain-containing protein [bacterium]